MEGDLGRLSINDDFDESPGPKGQCANCSEVNFEAYFSANGSHDSISSISVFDANLSKMTCSFCALLMQTTGQFRKPLQHGLDWAGAWVARSETVHPRSLAGSRIDDSDRLALQSSRLSLGFERLNLPRASDIQATCHLLARPGHVAVSNLLPLRRYGGS